jgi:hypothetical protein
VPLGDVGVRARKVFNPVRGVDAGMIVVRNDNDDDRRKVLGYPNKYCYCYLLFENPATEAL